MTQNEIDIAIQEQQQRILAAQSTLSSLDYIGTKIAMGIARISDYKQEIAQSEQCRAIIREATNTISELQSLIPDTDESSFADINDQDK